MGDRREAQEGGSSRRSIYICIHIADSHCCTAELYTWHSKAIILQLKKINFFFLKSRGGSSLN